MVRSTQKGGEFRGTAVALALWFVVWTAAFVASPFLAFRWPCVWQLFEGVGRAVYAVGLVIFVVLRVLQALRKSAAPQSEAGQT